jgi:hypothetical protein
MSQQLTFRQRDVKAAIKAVESAGHAVARVEIDRNGRIVVVLKYAGEDVAGENVPADQPEEPNPFDVALGMNIHTHRPARGG